MSETEKTILGRTFTSTTTGLFKDGFWEVISSMEEKRTTDGENWEEKKISAMSLDKTFAEAYNTAIGSVVEQFSDIMKENKSRSLFPNEIPNITQVV